jgi:hypothetical protein
MQLARRVRVVPAGLANRKPQEIVGVARLAQQRTVAEQAVAPKHRPVSLQRPVLAEPVARQLIAEQPARAHAERVIDVGAFARRPRTRQLGHVFLLDELEFRVPEGAKQIELGDQPGPIKLFGLHRYVLRPLVELRQRAEAEEVGPFDVALQVVRHPMLAQDVGEANGWHRDPIGRDAQRPLVALGPFGMGGAKFAYRIVRIEGYGTGGLGNCGFDQDQLIRAEKTTEARPDGVAHGGSGFDRHDTEALAKVELRVLALVCSDIVDQIALHPPRLPQPPFEVESGSNGASRDLHCNVDVRVGSIRDVAASLGHVRSSPNHGHWSSPRACRKGADFVAEVLPAAAPPSGPGELQDPAKL